MALKENSGITYGRTCACTGLGERVLDAGAPGTYRSIRETLTDLVHAEAGYVTALSGMMKPRRSHLTFAQSSGRHAMAREFAARNEESRARLEELVARLTARDLDRDLGEGWTVKGALAHVAWWDRYAEAMLDQWERDGFRYDDAFFSDLPNLASLPEQVALPAAYVLDEVLRAARAVDRRVSDVSDAVIEAATAGGMPRAFDRSVHRHEHIEQIERALRG